MREISHIVIHCSASPNGKIITVGTVNDWHRAREFRRAPEWREKQQKWLDAIGYHFFIGLDGVATNGRHVDETGAHVQGHNAHSLGICLAGTDHFNVPQWGALRELIHRLKKLYPNATVCGHRDMSPDKNRNGKVERSEWLKICPGFDVATWIAGGMSPLNGHILGQKP